MYNNLTLLDEKFIKTLSGVLERETAKPYMEIDTDLVNECVDFLCELKGNEVRLTKDEIEERVREIPFN